jgi:hypothetical protein
VDQFLIEAIRRARQRPAGAPPSFAAQRAVETPAPHGSPAVQAPQTPPASAVAPEPEAPRAPRHRALRGIYRNRNVEWGSWWGPFLKAITGSVVEERCADHTRSTKTQQRARLPKLRLSRRSGKRSHLRLLRLKQSVSTHRALPEPCPKWNARWVA